MVYLQIIIKIIKFIWIYLAQCLKYFIKKESSKNLKRKIRD